MTPCPSNRSSSTCLLEFFAQLLSSSGKRRVFSRNEKRGSKPGLRPGKSFAVLEKTSQLDTIQCFTRRWSFPLLFAHDGRSRWTLYLYSRLDSISRWSYPCAPRTHSNPHESPGWRGEMRPYSEWPLRRGSGAFPASVKRESTAPWWLLLLLR